MLLQAILLVQQNKAGAAVKILEPLFEHIEPMQEQAAVRICILLMELYLANKHFAQAASKHICGMLLPAVAVTCTVSGCS